jgi:hydrogenase nickel incorporation protein HypA/HybF
MHELSICRSIAQIAEQHADGRPVRAVHVQVGHLRQVVPDTLIYCWALVVEDTSLDGTTLEIDHVPAELACRACGQVTTIRHPVLRCGSCESTDTTLLTGEELFVTSLDLQGV